MTDYIKRDDAMDAIGEAVADGLPKGWYLPLAIIPSADVAPVRHGRWMDMKGFWMCSECHKDTLNLFKYCPYCGAKMDEGGSDGTDDC